MTYLTGYHFLSAASVDATARDIDDWAGLLGDGDRWRYYEAFECEDFEDFTLISDNGWVSTAFDAEGARVEDEDFSEVDPYMHGSEGPVMSHMWPIEDGRIDPIDAAYALRDLPVCVIADEDGDVVGLALTGGGMDLSWELAGAYVALGFKPPLALLDLPKYAGSHPLPQWKRDVILAYRESVDWWQSRVQRAHEHIVDLAVTYGLED